MLGTVRIINKHSGVVALHSGESLVPVDRTSAELGNPWPLGNPNDDIERDLVCDKFEQMADYDMTHGGPVHGAVMALAHRVADGENLILQCWCVPKRCHGMYVAHLVRVEAGKIGHERVRASMPNRRKTDETFIPDERSPAEEMRL